MGLLLGEKMDPLGKSPVTSTIKEIGHNSIKIENSNQSWWDSQGCTHLKYHFYLVDIPWEKYIRGGASALGIPVGNQPSSLALNINF